MKNYLACFVIVVLGVAPLVASAEDFSWGDIMFQPRAYVGYANYELSSNDFTWTFPDGSSVNGPLPLEFSSGSINGHNKLSINGLLVGIGGTVSAGRFFSDFYYQSIPNDTAYQGYRLDDQNHLINFDIGDVNLQHKDWVFSLGYTITDQWLVFAGYKSGSTEWDQKGRAVNVEEEIFSLNGKFDQNGPFLGTSYSLIIGPGALNFKVAYAYLDGTYEFMEERYTGLDVQTHMKLNGNSNAISLGVSWTQSLTDNLGVSIGANYQMYKFGLSGGGLIDARLICQPDGGICPAIGIVSPTQASGGTLTEELFNIIASLTYTF